MPNSPPCSSSAYLHGHWMIAGGDYSHEFEELDPSGRYGRYKDVLGKGAFKVVYRGFDVVDGMEVAWNQIKVQNARHTAEDIEQFYSEVHLLKTLKHKNIIKFYHSWVDIEAMNINFLTEIFTSGTLRMYRKRHKCIDIRAIKKWSRQILRGLLYLHSQDPPVIHRDLKCDNIFINGNQGEVKIGDLGLATILNQAHATQAVIGTPEFMAPELYEKEYTELVDIYSFGMCLLEMVTGEYPYSECASAVQIYKKVTSGKKPMALNKIKNLQLREFVEKCIASVSKRLPARELLMDSFLQEDESCDAPRVNFRYTGSLSDIRTSVMDRSLANAGSFSSLPDICQEQVLDSPINSHRHCRSLTKQNNVPTFPPVDGNVARTMDFQIKGKKMEEGIVQLRLRIADTEGEVRVIHFPFDVMHDTASSVAAEMVAELELMDQDAKKVAEIIDDAVRIMVPSWHKSTTNIDYAYGTENEGPVDDANSCEHPSVMSLESCTSEQSETSLPSWQHEQSLAEPKHSQMEPTVHGRFEEIAYHEDAAAKRVPPTTNDDSVTSSSSEESWDSTHSPRLSQSLVGTSAYQLSAAQNMLETLLRGEMVDGGVETLQGVAPSGNATLHSDLSSSAGENIMTPNDRGYDPTDLQLQTHHEQEPNNLQLKHSQVLSSFDSLWQEGRVSMAGPG